MGHIAANMEKLFVSPWDQYLLQCKKNAETIRLRKLYHETYESKNTETANGILHGDDSSDAIMNESGNLMKKCLKS